MTDMLRDIHVYPVDDLQEHLFCEDCWCGPSRAEDEPNVVVHNSADGREWHEQETLQ